MAAATVPGFVRDDRIGGVAGDRPEIVQALQVDGLRHPLLGQHAGTQHHGEDLFGECAEVTEASGCGRKNTSGLRDGDLALDLGRPE